MYGGEKVKVMRVTLFKRKYPATDRDRLDIESTGK